MPNVEPQMRDESSSEDTGPSRRMVLTGAAAVATAALLVAIAVARDEGPTPVTASAPAPSAGSWTALPDPPISGRTAASAAWTGSEIVVAGGWEFLCPPGADCAGPTEPPFTDGAAFDPATDRWRPIAESPIGFAGEQAVVVAGDLVVLADCVVGGAEAADQFTNPCAPGSTTALLRYDSDGDAWTAIPGPPADPAGGGLELAAVGDSIVAFAISEETGERREWLMANGSAEWSELPDDPLPPMYDRSFVAGPDGRSLFLVGAATEGVSSEPSEQRNLVAQLDLTTGTWTELPSSISRGYRAWGIDREIILEPHFGGTGGRFDVPTMTWSDLPGTDDDRDPNRIAGVIGRDRAVYVEAAGWAFDTGTGGWLEIEPVDDRNVFPPTGVTAVGRDLFVFGGERWTGPSGELLGDAWVWESP